MNYFKKRTLKKDILSWMIAVPSIVLLILFIWGPMVQNVYLSFFKTEGFNSTKFVFFDNYIGVFKDADFLNALKNTFIYVFFSLLIGFFVPIILALFLSEVIHTKSLFKIGLYIPNIVPAMAVILMWKIMMDPNNYGFLNIILQRLGLNQSQFLFNPKQTIPLIILTLTWKSAGSTMLIYLATLQSIDTTLYEASRISGSSVFQRLRYITLPAIFQNIKLLLILQVISIFQIFYEPLVFMGMSDKSANTLGLLIYKYIYGTTQNVGYSAALGVITMIILLILTMIYLYFDKKSTINNYKNKLYVSYEELLSKKEIREKKKFYLILKKIKDCFSFVFKKIYAFLTKIKLIWLLKKIKNFFSYLFSKTKKFTYNIFKSKKEGILNYQDYKKSKNRILYYFIYVVLLIFLLIVLIPFLWLVFSSFKSIGEILTLPKDFQFFPKSFNFNKYKDVIIKTEIIKNVGNSLIIIGGALVCSVIFNGLLAYVVSILKPKGYKIVYYLILFSMLIPVTISLAPLSKNIYSVYDFIGKLLGGNGSDIQKTYLVFIPFWLIAGANPFNFLLFKSYFDSLPKDLFEMAEVEGANKIQIFFKIVVPLSMPIIMVVGIFTITSNWNDFLLPYIIITSDKLWTVMIKVFNINAQMYAYGVSLDELLCLLVFTMIPPLIIFFIFQKHITNNQASTGIK